MINKSPPFEGLNFKIPIMIPIKGRDKPPRFKGLNINIKIPITILLKGRGFINLGSTLGLWQQELRVSQLSPLPLRDL